MELYPDLPAMNRQTLMFWALLLFGSSVLASDGNAGNMVVSTQPKWLFWSSKDPADQFVELDAKISDMVESAYQDFKRGSGQKGYKPPNSGYIDFDTMIQVVENPDGTTFRRAVRRKGPADSSIGSSTGICQWSFFDFNGAGSWKPYRESQPIKSSTIEKAYLENLGRGSVKIVAVTFNFDLWTSKVSVSWRRPKPLRRECSPASEGKPDGAKLKLSRSTWLYWSIESKQLEEYPPKDSKLIEKAYQLFLAGKGPKKAPGGPQFYLQVDFPRGFKTLGESPRATDKLMIDFKSMRQFVERVVPARDMGYRTIPAGTEEFAYCAIRRVHLGAQQDLISGYIREINAAHSLNVPQDITNVVGKYFINTSME
eukprot:512526_1